MEHRHRIMVVEDSGTQALKLQSVLEDAGWEVTCVSAAEPALAELGRGLPDLIVVDYYLPGMRGDELCRRIRMNVNTRGLPILMLTVEETHAAEMHGLESGADDYLPKSVDPEILLLRIRALLRKSQAQSSILNRGDPIFRRARLLAIDDSPTYLQYLTEELQNDDYQVEQAAGGKQGLERLKRASFDCVLVDLLMPDMDGIEVCRQITEMRRTMDNPTVVLMLTARENKEDMTRGLEAGADDFVGKSNDMAVLKARIRALLRRKFFQEENRRIIEELKNKELEAVRARAGKEAAEVRAAMAEKLAQTNRELEETNRKLRETQMHLIHSEKMASLGQLVAGIAHEINNPLAFVLNNVFTIQDQIGRLAKRPELCLSRDFPARAEKLRSRLEDMRQGVERVKELVLDLRTFSRLDEGKFKTVDIGESIDSVLRFLHHKMQERIKVEKTYGPVRKLSCHAGQLNQVLMNIIANAVDAIEGEGTITITTATEERMFLISIRDTGSGIPEAIRNRIFEPFFTTKPVGQGTGLGLSISYGIVQSHRGAIEARNRQEGGAEFVVKIPLNLERGVES
jgi:two-component system NtrC family sensor kinase